MYIIYGRLATNHEIIEQIGTPKADIEDVKLEVQFQQNMNTRYFKVWYEEAL